MLATTVQDSPADWESNLRKVCLAYNSTVHSTTGYSPFYLMFGREVRLPVDLMYHVPQQECTVGEFAATMRTQLRKAYEQVRITTNQQHLRQKSFYDRKVHGQPYQIGDRVWVFSDVVPRGRSRKFVHPWTGPFAVIKKLSDATYRVKQMQGRRKTQVVHFDRLKPCTVDVLPPAPSAVTPMPTLPPVPSAVTPMPTLPPVPQTRPSVFGEQLEILDSDDELPPSIPPRAPPPSTSRYPSRHRRPPTSHFPFMSH